MVQIILIGAGPMAVTHALVMKGMDLDFIVVGRGEESAKSFPKMPTKV